MSYMGHVRGSDTGQKGDINIMEDFNKRYQLI